MPRRAAPRHDGRRDSAPRRAVTPRRCKGKGNRKRLKKKRKEVQVQCRCSAGAEQVQMRCRCSAGAAQVQVQVQVQVQWHGVETRLKKMAWVSAFTSKPGEKTINADLLTDHGLKFFKLLAFLPFIWCCCCCRHVTNFRNSIYVFVDCLMFYCFMPFYLVRRQIFATAD